MIATIDYPEVQTCNMFYLSTLNHDRVMDIIRSLGVHPVDVIYDFARYYVRHHCKFDCWLSTFCHVLLKQGVPHRLHMFRNIPIYVIYPFLDSLSRLERIRATQYLVSGNNQIFCEYLDNPTFIKLIPFCTCFTTEPKKPRSILSNESFQWLKKAMPDRINKFMHLIRGTVEGNIDQMIVVHGLSFTKDYDAQQMIYGHQYAWYYLKKTSVTDDPDHDWWLFHLLITYGEYFEDGATIPPRVARAVKIANRLRLEDIYDIVMLARHVNNPQPFKKEQYQSWLRHYRWVAFL